MSDEVRPVGNPLESFSPDRTQALGAGGAAAKPPEPTPGLDSAAATMSSPPPAPGEVPPPADGGAPFRLRRRIGLGGMGEVWEAVQSKLSRPIAVKRLRADLQDSGGGSPADVDALRALFRQEALTAASLDHPNIVPVHDYSTDEQGSPLLAMKLVRGVTWSDALATDFPVLPAEEFLAKHLPVLIGVTQAVAFAHSRGIVHRDLKPSQVMVGEFGEVVLMDWGLAVSTGEGATPPEGEGPFPAPAPDRASASNPAGTCAFMAPEQTERSAEGIGTWTDVYLLGGILYNLLTGGYPHEATSAAEAFEQARRGVVTAPAERRPGREIPTELAELAMKAMAPIPADRIPSARDFLAALRDFLSGAGQRRESAELVAAARGRLDGAGTPSYALLASCDEALVRAVGLWPGNPEARPLHERVVETYARAALALDDLVLAKLQAERMSEGESRRGILDAIEVRRVARQRAIRQRRLFLAASLVFLALLAAGSVKYSVDQRRANRALTVERDRADRARGDAEELIRFLLGDLREKLEPVGKLELLDDVARRALAYFDSLPPGEIRPETLARKGRALRQIADVRSGRGDHQGALELLGVSRGIAERLVAADPRQRAFRKDLADVLFRTALAHRELGDGAAASKELRQAVESLEALVAKEPGPASDTGDLVEMQRALALMLRSQGDLDGALALARKGKGSLAALAEREPQKPQWRFQLATTTGFTAWILRARGDLDGAAAEYRAAMAVLSGLVAAEPANAPWKAELARTSSHLAVVLQASGDFAGALAAARKDLEVVSSLVATDPLNADWQGELGIAHGLVAGALRASGDARGALAEFEAAESTVSALARRESGNAALAREWGTALVGVGGARLDLGDASGALAAADQALERLRPVAEKLPKDLQARRRIAQAENVAGQALTALRRPKEARERYAEAIRVLEPVVAGSEDAMFLSPWAEALVLAGDSERARGAVSKLLAKGWKDPRQLRLFREKGYAAAGR